jgi:Ion transport protein
MYDTLVRSNETYTSPPLQNLVLTWAGAAVPRNNFHSFGSSFVTMFNMMVFNTWFETMINTLLIQSNWNSPWFFLIWIVASNYFLLSTLMAAVTSILEEHAQTTLGAVAMDNRLLLDLLNSYRNRLILRAYFIQLRQVRCILHLLSSPHITFVPPPLAAIPALFYRIRSRQRKLSSKRK